MLNQTLAQAARRMPCLLWQVGIIRGVEVELQSAARDLQEMAKVEKDKMRKWGKMAEEARTQLAALYPTGRIPVPCR